MNGVAKIQHYIPQFLLRNFITHVPHGRMAAAKAATPRATEASPRQLRPKQSRSRMTPDSAARWP